MYPMGIDATTRNSTLRPTSAPSLVFEMLKVRRISGANTTTTDLANSSTAFNAVRITSAYRPRSPINSRSDGCVRRDNIDTDEPDEFPARPLPGALAEALHLPQATGRARPVTVGLPPHHRVLVGTVELLGPEAQRLGQRHLRRPVIELVEGGEEAGSSEVLARGPSG